jgi:hypothetical protein
MLNYLLLKRGGIIFPLPRTSVNNFLQSVNIIPPHLRVGKCQFLSNELISACNLSINPLNKTSKIKIIEIRYSTIFFLTVREYITLFFQAMDFLQSQAGCCGNYEPKDWEHTTWSKGHQVHR